MEDEKKQKEDEKKQKQVRWIKFCVWAFIVLTLASYVYSIYNIVKSFMN